MKLSETEIHVSSWKELISELHSRELVQFQPEEGEHFRSHFVFRGMDDEEWDLQTSLQRLPRDPSVRISTIERSLIRSFRKYASAGTFDEKSEWYILAVAQHNGLPTRCLDWTASPLVAAHFACAKKEYKDKNGVIWCLHAGLLRDLNNENNKATSLHGISWVYDTRLLRDSYSDLAELDNSNSDGELLLLWEPPSLDSRIANQAGLLSIMNNAGASQDAFLRKYSSQRPGLALRIVINAAAKPEIRDMLDQNNISERTMFPGLPGLCDWLRRYYGKAW
jgi:hypothetical protein